MKILVVHGVSHVEAQPRWQENYSTALLSALRRTGDEGNHSVSFFLYDQKFESTPIDGADYEEALKKLLVSFVSHGIGDIFNRPRDLVGFVKDRFRWTAGMVAQWSTNEDLRKDLRESLLEQIVQDKPDIIVAHSMGSLIAYDLLTEQSLISGYSDFLKKITLVTLGSQIQNPGLREMWGGHLEHLTNIKHWYNLYNPHDRVLVTDITLLDAQFTKVLASFTDDSPFCHAWEFYVGHSAAVDNVWRPIVSRQDGIQAVSRDFKATTEAIGTPKQRALLVGINNYPNPENRLEGCVNDVFQMSATLQECGFAPEDIRIVLDDRATADGIRERLGWLLDDVRPGDRRIFFYSGHGAQIPQYDVTGKITGNVESLVPYDFNFEPATSITDLDMMEMYANLPYKSEVVFIFDCCHSGGLTREGGAKVRGITPPDDIRHRMLKWDVKNQMWVQRDLTPLMEGFASEEQREMFVGSDGSTMRIGRATPLRSTNKESFDKIREAKGNFGPFMPMIISACKEDQLSFEYRHGVVSYGAFTYSLTKILRELRGKKGNPTFVELVAHTRGLLAELKYNQTPDLAGPSDLLKSEVPWMK